MTAVMGTRMLRKEDPKLLTGENKFIDDIFRTTYDVYWRPVFHETDYGADGIWERTRTTVMAGGRPQPSSTLGSAPRARRSSATARS